MIMLVNSNDALESSATTKHTFLKSVRSSACQYTCPKYDDVDPSTAKIALYLRRTRQIRIGGE